MIKPELIDLINKKQMWAFIGAGPSIDSGFPSWRSLIDECSNELRIGDKLKEDRNYIYLLDNNDYPACFQKFEEYADRKKLENTIVEIFTRTKQPSEMLSLLVRMPFKGYITTNYDNLIEEALKDAGVRGFVSIANKPNDIQLTTAAPEKIIWHIHGSIKDTQSRLIITENDYNNLYYQADPLKEAIKALIIQNRILYIGYGFADKEYNILLRQIGIHTPITRPSYAFLGFDVNDKNSIQERDDLFQKYNIDVIKSLFQ